MTTINGRVARVTKDSIEGDSIVVAVGMSEGRAESHAFRMPADHGFRQNQPIVLTIEPAPPVEWPEGLGDES